MNRPEISLIILLFLGGILVAQDKTMPYEGYLSWSEEKLKSRLDTVRKTMGDSLEIIEKIELLIQERELKERLRELIKIAEIENLQERFTKGVHLIRILYEKCLDLDHYYSSTATFQEISAISNPNNYNEFKDLISELNSSRAGKQPELPNLLSSNVYASLIQKFVLLFNGQNKNISELESKLEKAECILDFSLNLTNSLNTIYYESEFLRRNNQLQISQIEELFMEVSSLIKYDKTLSNCREIDDWELLNNTIKERFSEAMGNKESSLNYYTDIQFIISKIINFTFNYIRSVENAKKYYEKFYFMLKSYGNDKNCQEKISSNYTRLKNRISSTIEKFEKAYLMADLDGSILKAISFGSKQYIIQN